MGNYKNDRSEVYTARIRAGKRTYFFDVKSTRGNDYYITITESKRRFGGDGYDKHKIFLYKEDFNKFLGTLSDTVDYVKSELLPDYEFNEFDREKVAIEIFDEHGNTIHSTRPLEDDNDLWED
ncbi:MAG: DUF3276 family protein [Bacteroidia bacterium]|nr:DUF3276 family protein [Bacteroidia bacterium]